MGQLTLGKRRVARHVRHVGLCGDDPEVVGVLAQQEPCADRVPVARSHETADVFVHPDDAAAAGIEDGEPVVVRSGRAASWSAWRGWTHPPGGAVSVPHGHQRTKVNRLTSKEAIDRVTAWRTTRGWR